MLFIPVAKRHGAHSDSKLSLDQLCSFDQAMEPPFLEEFLVKKLRFDRVELAAEELVAFLGMLVEERIR